MDYQFKLTSDVSILPATPETIFLKISQIQKEGGLSTKSLKENLKWPNAPHCRKFSFKKICDHEKCLKSSSGTVLTLSEK